MAKEKLFSYIYIFFISPKERFEWNEEIIIFFSSDSFMWKISLRVSIFEMIITVSWNIPRKFYFTIDHLIDLIFKFHRVKKDYIIYLKWEENETLFFLTSVLHYELDSISLFWIFVDNWSDSRGREKRHPTASSWVLQGFKRLRIVHLEL